MFSCAKLREKMFSCARLREKMFTLDISLPHRLSKNVIEFYFRRRRFRLAVRTIVVFTIRNI